MQLKARLHETLVYLALRPSYFIAGKAINLFPKSVYLPGVGYCVNDPLLAREILQDKEHFSFNDSGALGTLISELWGTTPTILSMEGVEHKRVKFALLRMFADDKLEQLIGSELKGFAKAVDEGLAKGPVDIARLTRIHTNRVTTKLLTGEVKVSDEELLEISDLITRTMGTVDLLHRPFSTANRAIAENCVAQFKSIAKRYYDSAPAHKTSIINQLKELGYEGENAYGFISMFLVAGTVTVSAGLPRIVSLLIETGQLSLLTSPEAIAKAIDEGLRYITPGPILMHGVKATGTVDGKTYIAGRRVLVLLPNIMHRRKFNANPNKLEVNREQNPATYGLWFGTGAHFCMGSVIAKAEMTKVLSVLAAQNRKLKVIGRKYQRRGINPGYESLLISRV